jgi:hypothetical protein
MPLQKQQVTVNFSQGVNTKSDPWQVPIGQFLNLENSVFDKVGQLKKRNGFTEIGSVSDPNASTVSTFKGELTVLGQNVYAYNNSTNSFLNKGRFQPVDIDVLQLVKNGDNQLQSDIAISSNGLICVVYRELERNQTTYKYAILDLTTGQNLLSETINPGSGTATESPRVFLVNNYFVIVFSGVTGGTYSLRYLYIDTATLTVSSTSILVSDYNNSSTNNPSWDGVVCNNSLIIGYNSSSSGGLNVAAILPNITVFPGIPIDASNQANVVSACTDNTNAYISYYDETSGKGYVVGVTQVTNNIVTTFSPSQWILTKVVGNSTSSSANITNIANTSSVYGKTQLQATSSPLLFNLQTYISSIPTSSTITMDELAFTNSVGATFTFGAVKNIASIVVNGQITILSEIENYYPYFGSANVATNLIYKRTCLIDGTMSAAPTEPLKRGVGLASKAFSYNDTIYFLTAYSKGNTSITNNYPTNQAGYYLLDDSGNIIAKLAYTNGGGYLEYGLPSVPTNGSICYLSYLYANLVKTTNVSTDLATTEQVNAVYAQTGINLAKLNLSGQSRSVSEIGSNLNISNGYLTAYDGSQSTEQGFFVYPDLVSANAYDTTGNLAADTYFYRVIYEWTDAQNNIFRSAANIPERVEIKTAPANFTATVATGSNILTSVSSVTGLQAGQPISSAGNIPPGTIIISVGTNTITMSDNGLANAAAQTFVPTQLKSTRIYIPTLRLSYKTNVNINVYRWSKTVPIYYQISNGTTIPTLPFYNDPNVDYITVTDTNTVTNVGNAILYTDGGIIENISPPPCSSTTIFDNRLWIVDAENKNLLWFSKTVLPTTPVEMSDLFTIYVSPTKSAQGGTGTITSLCSLDDKLIIFKQDSIYYLNGIGPDASGLNSQYSEPIFITSTVGCVNQNSIVFIPQGLVFESNKGLWILGRDLSTNYIGAPVEEITRNNPVKAAVNIPGTTQIRFSMSDGTVLMYDYFFQQWGTFKGIPNISSTLYQDKHTFLNKFGQILQEDGTSYRDGSNPVLMKFTTNWFALAGILGFQRAYFLFFIGKYYSPHKLNVGFAYDFNSVITQQVIITPNNYNAVFGGDPIYGSTTPYGGNENVEKWRIMLQKQKCDAVQITVAESYDPSFGVDAGAGLTLSAMNFLIGVKRVFNTLPASITAG